MFCCFSSLHVMHALLPTAETMERNNCWLLAAAGKFDNGSLFILRLPNR